MCLYGIMLLAIGVGIFAQDIAYLLHENINIPIMIGIGFPTVLSITLFFMPPILLHKSKEQIENKNKGFDTYLGIDLLAGMIISVYSIMIFIAWLG